MPICILKTIKGHWCVCRNNYFYAIGEFGRAMEKSKCPEYREDIGWTQHRLGDGNA